MGDGKFHGHEGSFSSILAKMDNNRPLLENLQEWPPFPDPYMEEALKVNDERIFWRLLDASIAQYVKELASHTDEAIKNFKPSYMGESPTHAALKLITYTHFAAYRDLTKLPIHIHYEWGSWEFGVLDLIIQDQPNYEIGRTRRLSCECITSYSYQKDPNIIANKLRVMQSYASMGLITGYFFTLDPDLPIELFINEKYEIGILVFPHDIFKPFIEKAKRLVFKTQEDTKLS